MSSLSFARALAGAALLLAALMARPAVPLAQNINEPEVDKGQTKLETFSQFQSGFNGGAAGNTRELHNLNAYYGVTDFWMIKGFLGLERPEHEGERVTVAGVENTFEILNAKKSGGIGLAWWTGLNLALDADATNAASFGPIVRLGSGPLSLILNPILERTFGQNHEEGIAFVYGWQLKQELRKGLWLGIEGFGKLPDIGGGRGPEEHKIGPLVTFEWEVGEKRSLTLETGVLFGLTDATPDTAVKVQLTYTLN
jgi:hypothetical protein